MDNADKNHIGLDALFSQMSGNSYTAASQVQKQKDDVIEEIFIEDENALLTKDKKDLPQSLRNAAKHPPEKTVRQETSSNTSVNRQNGNEYRAQTGSRTVYELNENEKIEYVNEPPVSRPYTPPESKRGIASGTTQASAAAVNTSEKREHDAAGRARKDTSRAESDSTSKYKVTKPQEPAHAQAFQKIPAVSFDTVSQGYSKEQVDEYIKEIYLEYGHMYKKYNEYQKGLEALSQALSQAHITVNKILARSNEPSDYKDKK